jgi:hypothetical protein
MYKWFGLEDMPCHTCEVLRTQLDESNRERKELLNRILATSGAEPSPPQVEKEMKPIMQQQIPWRVRQQMLEAEDRKRASLMKQKNEEIEELEKELGIRETEDAIS